MFEYVLGVVGQNISYSKSPFIHSAFAEALGLSLQYSIQDVGQDSFELKLAKLQQEGFYGCNITVPFKEQAFLCADVRTTRAAQAGAANTFTFRAGKIYADNTDGLGLVRDLTQNLGFSLLGKKILICGAGGASRGILGPLIEQKPALMTIANRNHEKAALLVANFSNADSVLLASSYEQLAGQAFDLVLDATSLKTETLAFPEALSLNQGSLVYDLKYSSEQETNTMRWGRAKAARVYDGMGMLVEQAAVAFNIWTGIMPDTKPVLALMQEKFYQLKRGG